jgi:hypothetical protein
MDGLLTKILGVKTALIDFFFSYVYNFNWYFIINFGKELGDLLYH